MRIVSLFALVLCAVLVVHVCVVSADDCSGCGGCCADRCNCVAFARCNVPQLPNGLVTCADKKAAANSRSGHAGCVMFRTGDPTYCHAAVVTGNSGGVLSINQANWSPCQCSTAQIKEDDPAILGFWCP
eukprot:ANDGO_04341.mRNA.1 hypothetical protein